MIPKEFCSFILELREKHLRRTTFAQLYPWHINTLKGYEKDRLPDVDYLYALADVTGYDFYELLKKRLLAGYLGNTEGFVFDKPPFNSDGKENELHVTKKDTKLSCFVVSNDTMSPTIYPGATINVDHNQKTLTQGHIFAFDVDGEITPRRVQKSFNGQLTLIADNSTFENAHLTKEEVDKLLVIGRVVSCLNPL